MNSFIQSSNKRWGHSYKNKLLFYASTFYVCVWVCISSCKCVGWEQISMKRRSNQHSFNAEQKESEMERGDKVYFVLSLCTNQICKEDKRLYRLLHH